jgi:RNA polymerase sigma factor (sigma-70 family)
VRTEDGYIIHRCLNGDSNAFGFLVDKYKAGVYAFAYERLHNFHDAEDISQEVFLKAYKSLRTLKRWDSFASWLYRITLNLCRNWIRAQSSRPDREFTEDQDPEVLEAHSRNTYRQEVAYESFGEALDSIPEMYRQALTLHYFGGMTSMEIARFTGVSPSAIRMRLRRARSLLKEEILTMMSTEYEQQRLQASFTFRILEAVKRIRIHPTPRTAGLPWGLSLATGIIVTFLTLTPQPSIISRVATATGSPLPVETKVLKTGEIPVDVLEVSEIPTLASKPGSELPDPQTSMLAAANSEDDISANEAASEKQVITDPETGVEYTKIMTLTGRSDVIKDNLWRISLSPNGRFLLWDKTVIPLDGSEPFDLVDMPAYYGTWSPDGRKAVFRTREAIWVIPVSPETGRSTGAARRVLDGEHQYERCCWLPDSERIVIERRDEETPGNVCILSVIDGTMTQITNDSDREWEPICSPDGKTIAYRRGYQLQVIPAEGGTHRRLINEGRPVPTSWSPDSEWLVHVNNHSQFWKGFEFYRLADGRQSNIMVPQWEVGTFLSWSPDGEKMLFYRSSYDLKESLKVVSASNGQPFELGGRMADLVPYGQYWSPDSSMIVTWARDGELRLWIFPLAGGEPFPLRIDALVDGKPKPVHLSPDCKNLAFAVQQNDGTQDLYVAPVSLKDGRTTGPAVKVFSGWYRKYSDALVFSWSPDGRKIAIGHEWDIWLVPVEGGEPVQITSRVSPRHRYFPTWSPDGEMISYIAYNSEKEQFLRVVPASGNEDMAILDIPVSHHRSYQWSPDSKDIVYFSEGVVTAISIADGKSRQLIDLRELPIDRAGDFSWSPDMKTLIFRGYRSEEDSRHIFIGPAGGGRFAELAADDHSEKQSPYWSPDGKWISYGSRGYAKTRPGGDIWEADVSDFLSSQEREQ